MHGCGAGEEEECGGSSTAASAAPAAAPALPPCILPVSSPPPSLLRCRPLLHGLLTQAHPYCLEVSCVKASTSGKSVSWWKKKVRMPPSAAAMHWREEQEEEAALMAVGQDCAASASRRARPANKHAARGDRQPGATSERPARKPAHARRSSQKPFGRPAVASWSRCRRATVARMRCSSTVESLPPLKLSASWSRLCAGKGQDQQRACAGPHAGGGAALAPTAKPTARGRRAGAGRRPAHRAARAAARASWPQAPLACTAQRTATGRPAPLSACPAAPGPRPLVAAPPAALQARVPPFLRAAPATAGCRTRRSHSRAVRAASGAVRGIRVMPEQRETRCGGGGGTERAQREGRRRRGVRPPSDLLRVLRAAARAAPRPPPNTIDFCRKLLNCEACQQIAPWSGSMVASAAGGALRSCWPWQGGSHTLSRQKAGASAGQLGVGTAAVLAQ